MEEEQQILLQSPQLFVQAQHVISHEIILKGKQYQEFTNPTTGVHSDPLQVFQQWAQPIQIQDVNQATQWGVNSNNNGQLLNEFEEKQEGCQFKLYDLDTIVDQSQNEEMYDMLTQQYHSHSEYIEEKLNQGILNQSNTIEWKICQCNQKNFINPFIYQVFVENYFYIVENRYYQPLSHLLNLEQVQDKQLYEEIKKYDRKLNKLLNKFYINYNNIHYQRRKQRYIKVIILKPRLV